MTLLFTEIHLLLKTWLGSNTCPGPARPLWAPQEPGHSRLWYLPLPPLLQRGEKHYAQQGRGLGASPAALNSFPGAKNREGKVELQSTGRSGTLGVTWHMGARKGPAAGKGWAMQQG